MINDSQLPELSHYRLAELGLPLVTDTHFGELVSPHFNETSPIHRWFRFKESFSAALVKRVVRDAAASLGSNLRLLDPYCGVGTSLLASQQLHDIRVDATGIEYNPFIHFVAHTKCGWPLISPVDLLSEATRALEIRPTSVSIPKTDSLRSGRCMSHHTARRIISIRNYLASINPSGTTAALLLGLAGAVESLSRTRKDGRALRLVERGRINVRETLRQRWQMIADDVAFMKAIQVPWKTPLVLRGDGRTPSRLGLEPETFDVIVTSPPYPNNIDYTEVYKLELWLLGLVHDASEFLTLRRGTFRSHPTTAREAPTPEFLSEVRQGKLRSLFLPLVERTKEMPHPWRSRLLLGYFDDLYKALKEYMLLLRPGGMAFFVVGNSLHGGADDPYLIPTDLILAELARTCGFGIERVVVARGSKRRLSGNHFLRETVVVLRKPGVRGD